MIEQQLPDVITEQGIQLLLSGINPGIMSAETKHHYARPGNKFWKVLHLAGFTMDELQPSEQRKLLSQGIGLTNIVDRPTGSSSELTPAELRAGAEQLVAKVLLLKPKLLAIVGISSYRTAFQKPAAKMRLQPETIGTTKIWVLPNPSGRNAHFSLDELVTEFRALRAELEALRQRRVTVG